MPPVLLAPLAQPLIYEITDSGGRQLLTYFVGQVVGQLNEGKPTRRVMSEMIEEFVDTMERLNGLIE